MKAILSIILVLFALGAGAAQVDRFSQSNILKVTSQNTAVSVPASGNTSIIVMTTFGMRRMYCQILPTVNAFDAFIIQGRALGAAAASTFFSTAGNYTSPAGVLVGASGDLTTLASGATGWFIMDVTGLSEVTVQASGSGGASTVSIFCDAA